MENKLTPSDKLEEIIDKIFLLNHNLVSEMIAASQDQDLKAYKQLNDELENKRFKELADYYKELRDAIRKCILLEDEIIREGTEGLSDEAKQEIVNNEIEDYKDTLLESMEDRIKALFVSMDFIPVGEAVEDEDIDIDLPGYYTGKPEESLRQQEYKSLKESFSDQMEIIYIEDLINKRRNMKDTVSSPFIVPYLIDCIGKMKAFEKAEKDCKKYVDTSMTQEEVFDDFPELRDTAEQVEFLRLEQRYKRRFEEATGFLNPHNSYSKFFIDAYNMGTLPFLSGFSKKEIDERIKNRVKTYAESNKDTIMSMFKSSVKKFAKVRRKRKINELLENAKFHLSDMSKLPKRWIKKVSGKKNKEDVEPKKDEKKTKETDGKKSKSQVKKGKTIKKDHRNDEPR